MCAPVNRDAGLPPRASSQVRASSPACRSTDPRAVAGNNFARCNFAGPRMENGQPTRCAPTCAWSPDGRATPGVPAAPPSGTAGRRASPALSPAHCAYCATNPQTTNVPLPAKSTTSHLCCPLPPQLVAAGPGAPAPAHLQLLHAAPRRLRRLPAQLGAAGGCCSWVLQVGVAAGCCRCAALHACHARPGPAATALGHKNLGADWVGQPQYVATHHCCNLVSSPCLLSRAPPPGPAAAPLPTPHSPTPTPCHQPTPFCPWQGSNDGASWADLRRHLGDRTLCKAGQYASWPVAGHAAAVPYRFFRVLQVAPNPEAANPYHVCLSFWELYGERAQEGHTRAR